MAKMTLLEMVQDILNDLDSDAVNSIADTVEAEQVAQIIKTCYFEQISNRNWPHLKKLTTLDSSNDLSKPNYLVLPDNLREMISIHYQVSNNNTTSYKELCYKYPDEFLRIVGGVNATQVNVDAVVDYEGTTLYIINDKDPSYWTSFDDKHIVTDTYNSTVDDTLKTAKTQVLAYFDPTWEVDDSFIPDLPTDAFSGLLEEAKSVAFYTLKQTVNQKAEGKAQRQQRWLSRKSWRAHGGVRYFDYGRKNRKYS